ncbi:MAG: rRNA (guanosine2251-2-O)-methyltransferase [Chloroflexota bacterium]|nr:rRNA (guanosine2251-2-O)-methyltransferase [Chloroflexota bacterium]
MVIRECSNPQCAFRYPDPESDDEIAYCPKCGALAPISAKIDLHAGKDILKKPLKRPFNLVIVLDNIRSLHNVGAIFRTADGFGVQELHLCGITPTPEHPRFAKTALGAQDVIAWQHHRNALKACEDLKNAGYRLLALENPPESTNLYAVNENVLENPLALVLGNEVSGVDPAVIALCDDVLAIPMQGVKNSFNVATSFGIAVSYFYALALR